MELGQGYSRPLAWKIGFLVAASLLPAACLGKHNRAEVHYRVTVVVDEDGVERRGSAVWSSALSRPLLPLVSAYDSQFHGDAVPVRLANGGVLFVLLRSWLPEDPVRSDSGTGHNVDTMYRILFGKHIAYQGPDDIERIRSLESGKVLTGRIFCPKSGMLSWTEPLNSRTPTAAMCFRMAYTRVPSEKRELKPFDPACAYFEPNCLVHIKSVTVGLTKDPVDRPLTSVLPWMRGEYDFTGLIDGPKAERLGVSEIIFIVRS